VTVRFSPSAASSSSGTLTVSTNGGTTAVQLSGTGTAPPVSVELSTDDGSVETGFVADNLLIVNRLTPPRYPATLQTIRVFFTQFEGLSSPSGSQVKLLVFADPSGSGSPSGVSPLLVSKMVTIPTFSGYGAWVDYAVAPGVSIASGDFYVGYQAPNPAGGVGFAADSSGTQQQRGFFSTDGGVNYQGPLASADDKGVETKVNMMIRAVVSVPGL
jgi:hypothetical protein